MIVCNTMFKKRPSRLITYESGGIKSQIDYFLVRRLDRKLVKDVKTRVREVQYVPYKIGCECVM